MIIVIIAYLMKACFQSSFQTKQMNQQIAAIKNTRTYLLTQLETLSIDQLNEIPPGFNNNIVWNIGHIIAAQQGLCYIRSGNKLMVEDSFFAHYKSGTKPERFVNADEWNEIKKQLFSTLDQLQEDYTQKLFHGYTPFTSRYNVEIKNIDDAIGFIQFHEGLHYGVANALKKLVTKP